MWKYCARVMLTSRMFYWSSLYNTDALWVSDSQLYKRLKRCVFSNFLDKAIWRIDSFLENRTPYMALLLFIDINVHVQNRVPGICQFQIFQQDYPTIDISTGTNNKLLFSQCKGLKDRLSATPPVQSRLRKYLWHLSHWMNLLCLTPYCLWGWLTGTNSNRTENVCTSTVCYRKESVIQPVGTLVLDRPLPPSSTSCHGNRWPWDWPWRCKIMP